MSNNEEQKPNESKAIVLNRMYAGDYLSTNLGHEVINMFQADNGNHYLYLNARGNFTARGKDVGTMLLVRGIGDHRVEIVGMAKNLKHIESACCTLPRDIGKINTEVRVKQEELGITYGGIPIFDIFGSQGQQSVYVSYYCKKNDFFIPNGSKRLILEFRNKTEEEDKSHSEGFCTQGNNQKEVVITIKNHKFASTSLHQFIDTEEDLKKLEELCDTDEGDLWVVNNVKISDVIETSSVEERRISLFDICQIQNDENRFSNALRYFILQYTEIWQRLLQSLLKGEVLDAIESVTREEDAKVKKSENKKNTDEIESSSKEEDAKGDNVNSKDNTGGRIDLLLRTKKYYIIIENKIDSEIIVDNTNGDTQLIRYYNYVKYLKREQIKELQKEKAKIEEQIEKRREQLKHLKNQDGKRWKRWMGEVDDYTQKLDNIEQQISDVENKRIIGIVLTPNYNLPKDELLKVDDKFSFISVTYKDIYEWLKENALDVLKSDVNFKDFFNAMKQHTYEYKSEALYNDMLEKFVRQIQTCKAQKQHIK